MNLALQSGEVGTLYRNPLKHEDGKERNSMIFRVSVKEVFLAGSVESRTALFKTKNNNSCAWQSSNFLITGSSALNLEIIGACLPLYAY